MRIVSESSTRRPLREILGQDSGPSPFGSTYWTRFLQCSREHFYANIMSWQPVVISEALTTGLLWHSALEAYYSTIKAWQARTREQDPTVDRTGAHYALSGTGEAQQAAFKVIDQVASEPGYEQTYETLARMLDTYFITYQDRFEVIATEVDLAAPLGDSQYTARLDLFVYDYTMQPCMRILEHKSTYQMTFDVCEGYTQDLQVMGQCWLAHKCLPAEINGVPFAGVTVNLTSKQKTPVCERIPVAPTPAHLKAWEEALIGQQRLMRVADEERYPRNYAACTRKYGRCDFFALCKAFPDVELAQLHRSDIPPGYR